MFQVRNVPEPIKRKLRARATALDMTMSAYVLQVLEDALSRPTAGQMLERLATLEPVETRMSAADLLAQARSERSA